MLVAHHTDDVSEALGKARDFLHTDPILHNVQLTVMAQRIEHPMPGNYWWVADGPAVVGFAMQTPVTYFASVAPATTDVLDVLVPEVVATAPDLTAEAATAAAFAGRWASLRTRPARPHEGQRVYVLTEVRAPDDVPGSTRLATEADLDMLLQWNAGFCADTGQVPSYDPVSWTLDHVAHERIHVWEADAPVSTALANEPVVGVTRVGYVYTPPEHRGHGYAAAVTAAVSAHALANGADRCMLYTQLSNPTSNAIYQRLGYEPVAEVLTYVFDR